MLPNRVRCCRAGQRPVDSSREFGRRRVRERAASAVGHFQLATHQTFHCPYTDPRPIEAWSVTNLSPAVSGTTALTYTMRPRYATADGHPPADQGRRVHRAVRRPHRSCTSSSTRHKRNHERTEYGHHKSNNYNPPHVVIDLVPVNSLAQREE